MSDTQSQYRYTTRSVHNLGAVVLLALVVASSALAQKQNPAADSPVDRNAVAVGSIPASVVRHQAKFVQTLAPEQPMRITLVLLSPKRAELQRLAADITNPKSPHYRAFLTFDQWKREFAPQDDDVAAVANWATGVGLKEVYRLPTNLGVIVQGSVAAVQNALHVQLSEYILNGHRFFGNNQRPTLPSDIAGRVDTVLGLSSFAQVGRKVVDVPAPRAPKGGPFVTRAHWQGDAANPPKVGSQSPVRERPRNTITGPLGGNILEPPDLWSSQAYDYNALSRLSHCCNPTNISQGSPKESSIAIVDIDQAQLSDYKTFFSTYGLAFNVTEIQFDGSACCNLETTTDIEWAGAMSNSFGSWQQTSHLFVYEGSGQTLDTFFSMFNSAFYDDAARILSASGGSYEDDYDGIGGPPISAFVDTTNAMIAVGWTLVAATGDNGAFQDGSNLSVSYPASDPNVIAAGGTTLSLGSAGTGFGFKGETAWTGNGGGSGGGGGGCSNTFFAPWWSSAFAYCPGGRRSLPDVSLNAGSPQAVFHLGQWTSGVGTSLVAPELAGFFAQAASYLMFIDPGQTSCHNTPYSGWCVPIGNPAPMFYLGGTRPFYDVNDGSCNGGGPGPGFCTKPGYDLATGVGSANMLQLAWSLSRYLSSPTEDFAPNVAFSGPGTNTWYSTDQTVNFTITGGTMGIAGYTAQWDNDPGDPVHSTPGSGDPFWDGPAVPFGTSGTLSLAAAGPGCHTAFVRAWNNLGTVSVSPPYGPICFGAPPSCTESLSCLVHDDNPPEYTVQCAHPESFFEKFQDGTQVPLGTSTSVTGETDLYNDAVLACDPGTNNCAGFSISVTQAQWCHSPGPPPPPKPPNCKACIAAGGRCTPKGCVIQ